MVDAPFQGSTRGGICGGQAALEGCGGGGDGGAGTETDGGSTGHGLVHGGEK
jgi:hypothetical protein